MKVKKYAAIDIGSNAIRLLIANVIEQKNKSTEFKKSSLVRVPIRLGADAFVNGKISSENISRMVKAMQAFNLLITIHNVVKFKACATSAMREASNSEEIKNTILKETGIDIDIIDGKKEASIISSTELRNFIKAGESYLYVDVGGGSTEITVFSDEKIVNSKSFKIGTVRLLNSTSEYIDEKMKEVKTWIKENTQDIDAIKLIGSGGNINKIFKMSGKEIGKALSYEYIKNQYKFFKSLQYEELISELGLNPDRADVIVPATKIYLSAMKWSKSTEIFVPKIGLSDGIIRNLYDNKL